ncbi:copper homeostasis protein CutC [Vibrio sp. UCD-FRSSP16_10]|uniref:copper homeostasis protein CutC n=1 Tax=unclassified Vibrio TaxID=2614977 RepID=UPI000801B8F4|nr:MULTISPECIES: copper homeostasis protein CutC [unclassified Vibrio]OBT06644.1 copper homeostasis protein CutC [Vibrio sp. UCD-FRSSP16_30]OBT12341.1 copper homeostasis protein CutC [Vibrio sp. UCD-FRSSP16_10]
MSYQLEVCIDNIESLHTAIRGGATRIELCSSLALGGLTPSFGLMTQAKLQSCVPIYAMIRPRQGDFLYSDQDIEIMLADIKAANTAQLDGIVMGLLTKEGHIDYQASKKLIDAAQGMGVTFHRAIDQCSDIEQALEEIIDLGCERVLTSGQQSNALLGVDKLAQMQQQAKGRIQIMAGAGVNEHNVQEIIKRAHIKEVHLSGKTSRSSNMTYIRNEAQMGSASTSDFHIPVTGFEAIQSVQHLLLELENEA